MRVKGVSVICALEKKINIKGMRERERERKVPFRVYCKSLEMQ